MYLQIVNGKSAGFQESHLCQFAVLLHSSCTTGDVKYIEINNIPQITLANKRLKLNSHDSFQKGICCASTLMHLFVFVFFIVFGSYKIEIWVHDVMWFFGHHMALVEAAGLYAQSLTYSELQAVVAQSQHYIKQS